MTDQQTAASSSASATTSRHRPARKIAVAVIGASILAFGVALIVLPGPAFIVIPLGLKVLAIEFLWARRLLGRLREGVAIMFPKSRAI